MSQRYFIFPRLCFTCAPSSVQKLVCTNACLYKAHIYKPSFVQNSFVQYIFFTKLECTTPCLYKTWIYKTLFLHNLNIQNLTCTKLEKLISFPCTWSMLSTQGCVLWNLQNQFGYTWSAELQPAAALLTAPQHPNLTFHNWSERSACTRADCVRWRRSGH